eukprot:jgi/Chrzof1/6622/Cz19g03030.t1
MDHALHLTSVYTLQFDGAKVIAAEKRAAMSQNLADFERQTGWHIRVYTSQGPFDQQAGLPTPSALWGRLDDRTVVLKVDPTSPNILALPYIGDQALFKLRRGFWVELTSRYGNMFYIREEGESAAVENAINAVTTCLGSPKGCAVVPGLPPNQYWFTFAMSVIGGVIAGFVIKLEPQGFVRRRWIWLLLFSPLWGSLFINFGLGPVLTRTADVRPVVGNIAAFLGAVVACQLPQLLQQWTTPQQSEDS